MSPAPKKRPRRIPYTPEEVAIIIEAKKRHEQIKLKAFKSSPAYRWQNVFNIACFIVYWELIICFFGPVQYQKHYSAAVDARYGREYNSQTKPLINEIDFYSTKGRVYTFVVNDFIDIPGRFSSFWIGSDFILHKNLKGRMISEGNTYRLFEASPVLLILLITMITSFTAYYFNLNQNAYSLMALTVLNGLSMLTLVLL